MAVPDRVVFDAEPLIAHADDERGSDIVEDYLNAVAAETTTGYACAVNLAEIRYTLARKYDRDTADEYLDWLDDFGIETVDGGDAWRDAAEDILSDNPALGDAFALAVAENTAATLLVGDARNLGIVYNRLGGGTVAVEGHTSDVAVSGNRGTGQLTLDIASGGATVGNNTITGVDDRRSNHAAGISVRAAPNSSI